jgi:hypothetical protein
MFARSIDLRRELRFISKDIIMISQVEDDAGRGPEAIGSPPKPREPPRLNDGVG